MTHFTLRALADSHQAELRRRADLHQHATCARARATRHATPRSGPREKLGLLLVEIGLQLLVRGPASRADYAAAGSRHRR